jgi:hypothetical protein
MSEFRVTIRTDNAAFSEDGVYEVARILRGIADDIELDQLDRIRNTVSLFDVNGNRVGGYKYHKGAEQ